MGDIGANKPNLTGPGPPPPTFPVVTQPRALSKDDRDRLEAAIGITLLADRPTFAPPLHQTTNGGAALSQKVNNSATKVPEDNFPVKVRRKRSPSGGDSIATKSPSSRKGRQKGVKTTGKKRQGSQGNQLSGKPTTTTTTATTTPQQQDIITNQRTGKPKITKHGSKPRTPKQGTNGTHGGPAVMVHNFEAKPETAQAEHQLSTGNFPVSNKTPAHMLHNPTGGATYVPMQMLNLTVRPEAPGVTTPSDKNRNHKTPVAHLNTPVPTNLSLKHAFPGETVGRALPPGLLHVGQPRPRPPLQVAGSTRFALPAPAQQGPPYHIVTVQMPTPQNVPYDLSIKKPRVDPKASEVQASDASTIQTVNTTNAQQAQVLVQVPRNTPASSTSYSGIPSSPAAISSPSASAIALTPAAAATNPAAKQPQHKERRRRGEGSSNKKKTEITNRMPDLLHHAPQQLPVTAIPVLQNHVLKTENNVKQSGFDFKSEVPQKESVSTFSGARVVDRSAVTVTTRHQAIDISKLPPKKRKLYLQEQVSEPAVVSSDHIVPVAEAKPTTTTQTQPLQLTVSSSTTTRTTTGTTAAKLTVPTVQTTVAPQVASPVTAVPLALVRVPVITASPRPEVKKEDDDIKPASRPLPTTTAAAAAAIRATTASIKPPAPPCQPTPYQPTMLPHQPPPQPPPHNVQLVVQARLQHLARSEIGAESPPAEARSLSASPGVRVDPQRNLMMLRECELALKPDEDGDLPLHIAVVQENSEMVQKLIMMMRTVNFGIDPYNKLRQTPLHLAVITHQPDITQKLLEGGADPNMPDRKGQSAVHLAIMERNMACLGLLVTRSTVPVNLNSKNYDGLSPLHLAVKSEQITMVQLVLSRPGVNIDIIDGKSGRTPLFHAAENNAQQICDLLLKHNANPNIQNYSGNTAVQAASGRGYSHIVALLVKHGADAYFKDAIVANASQKPSSGWEGGQQTASSGTARKHKPRGVKQALKDNIKQKQDNKSDCVTNSRRHRTDAVMSRRGLPPSSTVTKVLTTPTTTMSILVPPNISAATVTQPSSQQLVNRDVTQLQSVNRDMNQSASNSPQQSPSQASSRVLAPASDTSSPSPSVASEGNIDPHSPSTPLRLSPALAGIIQSHPGTPRSASTPSPASILPPVHSPPGENTSS